MALRHFLLCTRVSLARCFRTSVFVSLKSFLHMYVITYIELYIFVVSKCEAPFQQPSPPQYLTAPRHSKHTSHRLLKRLDSNRSSIRTYHCQHQAHLCKQVVLRVLLLVRRQTAPQQIRKTLPQCPHPHQEHHAHQ